jgi:hypothetical protein
MQYTIRNIPRRVDQILRKRAREQRKSLNDVTVEALAAATGVNATPAADVKYCDLSDFAGKWVEDPEFDKIMAEQDRIDPEMWR